MTNGGGAADEDVTPAPSPGDDGAPGPPKVDTSAPTLAMSQDEASGLAATFTDFPDMDPTLAPQLNAWAETVQSNDGAMDPALTFKPVSVPAEDDDGYPTLAPKITILRDASPAVGPFDYRVTQALGRGGMGEIHAAQQRVLRRPVALKMLLPDLRGRASAESRFVSEALITGRLQHPNIVPVHDLGRTRDGDLFMGMKLVRGETLSDLLLREPATDAPRMRRMLDIFIRLCDAMAYAHQQGVLHRDLKPDNVMVGEFSEVQVMDWGIATESDPSLRSARESGPCGTPRYMSPEQAAGNAQLLGPASDVYLLGAMLYQVLTGVPPHRGKTLQRTLMAALRGDVTPPSERAPDRWIPSDLEDLCMAALQRDVAKRLATVSEFRAGIDLHLTHSEALGLIDRARDVFDGDTAQRSAHEHAEDLSRAKILLQQALEMWPDATDAKTLASQVTVAQIDLALERGEARAAQTLADGLEGSEGVSPEAVSELQRASRRQLARRGKQVVVAVLLAIGTLGGYGLWQDSVAPELKQQAGLNQARTDCPEKTQAVWTALAAHAPPTEVTRCLDSLHEGLALAKWTAEPGEEPNDSSALHVAASWAAIRAGDRRLSAARLDGPSNGNTTSLLRTLSDGLNERGPAAMLTDAVSAQPTPGWRSSAAHTVRILYPLNQVPERHLAPERSRVRERLARLGARGVLLDAASGVPASLLYRDGEQPIRLRFLRSQTEDSGFSGLVAFDERTSQELWRFPPASLSSDAASLVAPVVLPSSDGDLAFVGWGTEILGIHMATGVVRRRARLFDTVTALIPSGSAEVTVFYASNTGRARSGRARLGPGGWVLGAPGGAGIDGLWFCRRELRSQIVDPTDSRKPEDPQRLEKELERLNAVALRDPTQPFLSAERGTRLLSLGREAEAFAALEGIFASDLSPTELAMIANELDDKHGLHDWADRLLEHSLKIRTEHGVNADLSPVLIGNPALFVRQIAKRAAEAGDDERLLRSMALAREFATALEMDKFFLPFERKWLLERGKTTEAKALDPYEERALRMGGAFMMPDVVAGLDLVLMGLVLLPCLLLAALVVDAIRTHAARVAALRALGFRTWGSRLAAFFTHPLLRLSHTAGAYATRIERGVFVIGVLLLFSAYVYQSAIIRKISHVAAVPISVGIGELDHPEAVEYVRSARDTAQLAGRSTAAHARLLAEGALRAGDGPRAASLLASLLTELPDDPFGNANAGVLAERRGARSDALAHYKRAAARQGELGAVGRYNVARLENRERPSLPPPYKAWLRLGDTDLPLRQFAAQTDLMTALGVSTSRWVLFRAELLRQLGAEQNAASLLSQLTSGSEGLFLGSEGGLLNAPIALGPRVRIPLLLAGLVALFFLPFPARPRDPPPSARTERWLSRVGQLATLVVPGSLLLARGRVSAAFCMIPVVPTCLIIIFVARTGGLLYALTLSNSPQPWGQLDATDLVVSDGLRVLGILAVATLVGTYLVVFAQAGKRALAWFRARGDATAS